MMPCCLNIGGNQEVPFMPGAYSTKIISRTGVKNAFTKHLALHHPDQEGDVQAFDFNLIQTFKHAAPRQTSESVHIHNSKADILLNSKVDFEQPTVERVVMTREPREEREGRWGGGSGGAGGRPGAGRRPGAGGSLGAGGRASQQEGGGEGARGRRRQGT